MEVLDLFLRDSNLGQFQARLAFLNLLLTHFRTKLKEVGSKTPTLLQGVRVTAKIHLRLEKVVNVMDFVTGYYS